MADVQVVIGVGFGDEGKGFVTDYLTRGSETLCVRFTGGAQAGHTVVEPNGRRHVFHHLGSGSLRGATTFLTKDFIVNPFLWEKELAVLGFQPRTIVDVEARVTTPYDMLLNQELEQSRGEVKHGSCGVGIYETVKRSEDWDYDLRVIHLNSRKLREHLLRIANEYVPKRLDELSLKPSLQFNERWKSSILLQNFIDACERFYAAVQHWNTWASENWVDPTFKHLLFEGAQGLLLDEGAEFFPYVTRGKTGLSNVAQLVPRNVPLEIFYVTRTYMTRHGAGPFPSEVMSLSFQDDTNAPNDWQGTLRFGYLDLPLLTTAIQRDLEIVRSRTIQSQLVVTHADQFQPQSALELSEQAGLTCYGISYGPTRDHLKS